MSEKKLKGILITMQELIDFAEGLWATNPNPSTYHASVIGKAKQLLEKETEFFFDSTFKTEE